MLEKLPEAVGHLLRDARAGLDHTVHRRIDLRGGTAAIELRSPAFVDHGPMPARCTADGAGVSPPLHWLGVPPAAAALLLIVEDADAPTPQPLVHAIAVDLPAGDGELAEGAMNAGVERGPGSEVGTAANVPAVDLGRNSFLRRGWLPPDPPPGHGVHRYVFQLFALETRVDFGSTPGRDAVLDAVRAHGIASGCLIGTYERPDGTVREPALGADGAIAGASVA